MANLLVTGGAGFIGANFVRLRRETRPDEAITVLDALTYAGRRDNLEGVADIRFVHGDIADTALVTRLLDAGIDTIVHFAAESHVDRSISDPDAFVRTNVLGTQALLRAAKTAWLDSGDGRPHRFHHVSTDEVFGSLAPHDPPFTETTPYAPNSPYAASKAASDHLVRAFHRTYGLQVTTSNCSNNFGPFQNPEKLIPLFLANALTGRALPIYGDGMNVRDWLYVADHCEGIARILDAGEVGETYNIGGGMEVPNLTVIDAICSFVDRIFAEQPELARRFPDAPAAGGRPTADLKRFVADRPGHDRRYAIDASRIADRLGFRPRHDFAEGLDRTCRWYLDHPDWWARSPAPQSLSRVA
ncbi:dTDP-glucose 4,6-dehydratase [Stakelama saccharophila]|uniref:dTDP-glucose 4,6-dehydratase n=1 Tax=Stakelama saccharophila TaxID=3075605 RepID=A0ABZ0B8T7_9SPHN|nr:dTDP-glucose 4,6-dehydratase [Stakelama sp. W311]WNO53021.1 dTDP-glucose 4,6-dehydratase [Stakelama sp. W311]